MSKKVERNYLEINSINDLNVSTILPERSSIQLIQPPDFQLNKFFYKNIGKKHHWVDRLSWTENEWINYTSDKKVKTYILKKDEDLLQEISPWGNGPSSWKWKGVLRLAKDEQVKLNEIMAEYFALMLLFIETAQESGGVCIKN